MIKIVPCATALLAALAATTAANAQHYAGHCAQCQQAYGPSHGEYFKSAYHDNWMWPKQYVWPARRGICQAFELTVANGWRRNNLLGKYDFTEDGSGLSEAGRLRVDWILTHAPPQRRTLFVQRGIDPGQTAERVEAVQLYAANSNQGGGPVDVQETYMRDEGRPAASVDAVFTGFGANQPPPVLPQNNSSGTGEGS